MKVKDKSRLRRAIMPLVKIHTDYDRFQFRSVDVDHAHVEDLMAAYRRKADIPPITVWEDPKSGLVFVLDGHHRYNALKNVNGGVKTGHRAAQKQATLTRAPETAGRA